MEKLYATPCLYGSCFYYKKNSACAYVNEKGKTNLVSCKNKISIIPNNIVFLRGMEYLIFGIYFFIKNLVKIPFRDYNKSISKNISKSLNVSYKQVFSVIICLLAFFVAIFFIGFLPVKIALLLSGYSANAFLNRFLVGIIKVALLYIVLIVLKFLTPFKQFYRFNACTNILTTRDETIYKPTNLLNYLVFAFSFTFFVLALVGLTSNQIWKPFVNLIITLFCFSVCYEILFLLENSKIKNLSKLCIITSFLVTEKPTKTEIYISLSAYNEVVFMQDKKRGIVNTEDFKNNELSFSSVYAECKQKLKNAQIEDASEADWLICEVLNISRGQLRLQTKVTQSQKNAIENATNKRIKGEPITKIFGKTNFYGYEFKVTKDVLSPRMETEILVEQVLKYAKDKMNILDLCTGSGIIAISIAKNVNANVVATDISDKALLVAQENAQNNQVKVVFKNSNMFENLKKGKKFDIIVSNPPYIPSQDISKLDKEVKDYDPKIALDGGEDGLDFYRKIIKESVNFLSDKGMIFFEIGINQKKSIVKMLEENFDNIKVVKDYNRIDRVVYAKLKNRKEIKNVRTNGKDKKKI